jgi:S1-C subfamily serine protease
MFMFSFLLPLLLAVIPRHVLLSSIYSSTVVVAKPVGSAVGSCQCRQWKRYHSFTPTLAFLTPEIPRQIAQKVHPSVALLSPIVGVRNMTSQGSGFVVKLFGDNEGPSGKKYFDLYVLTAAHVASPGKCIRVSFPYQTNNTYSYLASVIARDLHADLALLGLTSPSSSKGVEGEEKHLLPPPPLSLRNNEFPDIGELAFANGYPAGFDGIAMTSGIVCGTAKDVFGQRKMGRGGQDQILESNQSQTAIGKEKKTACCYVVTDAAMAGGMSGGPLVDVNGDVIGMNSLLRPDLGPLGNYAVTSGECQKFLSSFLSSRNAVPSHINDTLHQVVIFNDPINTRARVAQVLQDIAKLNATQAEECMLKAHMDGWSVVQTFLEQSDAERLCNAIQNEDILAELQLEKVNDRDL